MDSQELRGFLSHRNTGGLSHPGKRQHASDLPGPPPCDAPRTGTLIVMRCDLAREKYVELLHALALRQNHASRLVDLYLPVFDEPA